jgi:transcriptional regulator with XRE-family HTH domain
MPKIIETRVPRLTLLRLMAQVSIAELASTLTERGCKISTSQLQRVEAGHQPASAALLVALSKHFNVRSTYEISGPPIRRAAVYEALRPLLRPGAEKRPSEPSLTLHVRGSDEPLHVRGHEAVIDVLDRLEASDRG